MPVIYIKEQGALVQKKSERILITKGRKTLLDMPMDGITGISIIGNVQITTQALYAFMQKGIDVSYFTFSGKYIGATCPEYFKNIFLRLAQYNLYYDEQRRLEIAKTIGKNKIYNQIYIIQNHRWETEKNRDENEGKSREELIHLQTSIDISLQSIGLKLNDKKR